MGNWLILLVDWGGLGVIEAVQGYAGVKLSKIGPSESRMVNNPGEYERQEGEEKYWYEGDWDKDGWIHGWGILYRPDRTTVEREGWWQNGEPVDGPPAGYPDAP